MKRDKKIKSMINVLREFVSLGYSWGDVELEVPAFCRGYQLGKWGSYDYRTELIRDAGEFFVLTVEGIVEQFPVEVFTIQWNR